MPFHQSLFLFTKFNNYFYNSLTLTWHHGNSFLWICIMSPLLDYNYTRQDCVSQCFVSPQIVVWHMAEMQLKSVDWLVLFSKGEDVYHTLWNGYSSTTKWFFYQDRTLVVKLLNNQVKRSMCLYLETVVQDEVSQKEKYKCLLLTHICGI